MKRHLNTERNSPRKRDCDEIGFCSRIRTKFNHHNQRLSVQTHVEQNIANRPKGKLGRNIRPRGTRRSKWSRLNTTISRHCRKQQSREGMRCANSLKTLEGAARLSDVCCCYSNNVSCVDSFLHRSGKCCPGRSPYYRYLDHCHHYCESRCDYCNYFFYCKLGSQHQPATNEGER